MHIVLIEDNAADRRLIEEALAETALDTVLHWLPSGEQALAFLRREDGHAAAPAPDLVLLDLNLPGQGGPEVLTAIKHDPQLLHIPVVVLTSSSAQKDVMAAYDAHANAYMVKPDDFEHFVTAVGELHRYWSRAVLLPSHVR